MSATATEEGWDDEPTPVRIIETDSGFYPPYGADRQLLAAAPDMLEALIDCRRALEISNFTQELAIVNAAIAKASACTNL